MKFKVGDKVLYIGEDHPRLYIKKGVIYTISGHTKANTITLSEIKKSHDYYEREFKLASAHIIRERLVIK